jgi:FkbM family methyltransferase
MKSFSDTISQWLITLTRTALFRVLKSLAPKYLRQSCWNVISRQEEFLVMGSRMFIPPEARQRDLVMNCYEPAVEECLRRLVRPGMIFCDVGANIGVFTLLAARLVGPKGRVFSFEPVPSNFCVLRRNVEANKYGNVVCIPKAVSQQNGTSRLFLSRFCGSHSLVGEPAEYTGEFLDVETLRLDSLPGLKRIDVLKIDVEGVELDVLEGLGHLRPHVILEYNAERISQRGLNLSNFAAEIRALGYALTNIDCPKESFDKLSDRNDITLNLLASPEVNQ